MSTQRYTDTTTTTTMPTSSNTPGMGRNYSDSQYRGSNPNTSNYRDVDYDETRHHGRWTASGESRDLADSSSRYNNRDSNRDRDFDRSNRDSNRDFDRNNRDSDRFDRNQNYDRFDRNRSGYNSGFDSSYPSSGFGSNNGSGFGSGHASQSYLGLPYEGHYGSSYGMGSGFGSQFPHHYGMGSQYGSSGFGSQFPHHYGTLDRGFNSGPSQYAGLGLGGPSYGSGFGSQYGSQFPHHLAHMTLPPYGGSNYGAQGMRGLNQQQQVEADIYELGNDYIIELDLPGHHKDHITNQLIGNELLISSKQPRRSHNFHVNERSLGHRDVSRRFFLPQDAQTGGITSSLNNGVLLIKIPRNATTATTTGTTPSTGLMGSSTTTPSTTVVKDTVTTTTETKRV